MAAFLQSVIVECSSGMGESQEMLYDSPVICFCKFSGVKSITRTTATGFSKENRYRFIFQAGITHDQILSGGGESFELTAGSRIQYNGRYYYADSIEPQINEYNRLTEMRVDAVPGGKIASVEETAAVILDGQGVDHSILPSPQSAIRGAVGGIGGI